MWAYRRTHGDDDLLVALNMSDDEQRLRLPDTAGRRAAVILSGRRLHEEVAAEADHSMCLQPHEAVIIDLGGPAVRGAW